MDALRARLERHLQVLCGEIGERHLGSEGEARAAAYIARELEAAGCAVAREEFEAPGWSYGSYRLSLPATGETFPCFPCFYSNACDAAGKLLPFELDRAADLTGEAVRGRICFARGRFTHVGDTNTVAERLEALGAAAMVMPSPYRDTLSTKVVRNPELKSLAVVTVSQETAAAMAERLDQEFALQVEARNSPTVACNVVGRRGGEGAVRVVIGAHYDTAPGIQGAWDNASGVAVLLELARLLQDETRDCPVDFVAFGGEEFGGRAGYGLGGLRYVERHSAEMAGLAWMGCVDGVGAREGQLVVGVGRSDDLRRQVAAACGTAVARVGDFYKGSDNNVFHDRGLPTILFIDQGADGGSWPVPVHAPEDCLDAMDPDRLAEACRLIAATFGALLKNMPGH